MANAQIHDLTQKVTPQSTDELELQETGGGSSRRAVASALIQNAHGLSDGVVKVASGVLTPAVQGTDYYFPGGTDVAVADGGTGASTAAGALTNLGAAASGANTDITSVVLNQTGLVIKGATANGLTVKPNETLTAPRTLNVVTNDGTRTLTIPADASVSGTNTGDQTNISGNAATVTTNANLTGPITSVGNATSVASQTGTGSTFVMDTSPTINSPSLVTPALGAATATSVNKVAITAPATSATLTIPDGVTLTGPAASGTAMTLGNVETVTGAKTFNDGKLIVAGLTSGTTTVKATAAASGTITLPAATDTLVGKATTDTLTNKTFDTSGAGNVLKINGTGISALTGTGNVVLDTSPTIVTPTIADLSNMTHTHQSNAGGGALDAAAISTGTMATARLGSGTASATTVLCGDQSYKGRSYVFATDTGKTITNPTSITSILNSTKTVPANSLAVGDIFNFHGAGVFTIHTTTTVEIRIQLGSHFALTGITGSITNNAATFMWYAEGRAVIQATGTGGSWVGSGFMHIGTPGGLSGQVIQTGLVGAFNVGANTIDTTVSNSIDLLFKNATGDAATNFQLYEFEVLKYST